MYVRALIVDNNLDERAALMHYLREVGYASVAASTADQARETLEVEAFDVVLLEAELPDGDGFRLCNELREKLGDGMIIIFVSHRNTALDRTVGIQLGADDFIGKPCDSDELFARINARMRRRAAVPRSY